MKLPSIAIFVSCLVSCTGSDQGSLFCIGECKSPSKRAPAGRSTKSPSSPIDELVSRVECTAFARSCMPPARAQLPLMLDDRRLTKNLGLRVVLADAWALHRWQESTAASGAFLDLAERLLGELQPRDRLYSLADDFGLVGLAAAATFRTAEVVIFEPDMLCVSALWPLLGANALANVHLIRTHIVPLATVSHCSVEGSAAVASLDDHSTALAEAATVVYAVVADESSLRSVLQLLLDRGQAVRLVAIDTVARLKCRLHFVLARLGFSEMRHSSGVSRAGSARADAPCEYRAILGAARVALEMTREPAKTATATTAWQDGHRIINPLRWAPMSGLPLIVVTYASSKVVPLLERLVATIHDFEPGQVVVVYDLGLQPAERARIVCWERVAIRRLPPTLKPWPDPTLQVLHAAASEFQHVLFVKAAALLERPAQLQPAREALHSNGYLLLESSCTTASCSPATVLSDAPLAILEEFVDGAPTVSALRWLLRSKLSDITVIGLRTGCTDGAKFGAHVLNRCMAYGAAAGGLAAGGSSACMATAAAVADLRISMRGWAVNTAAVSRSDGLAHVKYLRPPGCGALPIDEPSLPATESWSTDEHADGRVRALAWTRADDDEAFPQVHGLEPAVAHVAGGDWIEVQGSGFSNVSRCIFGGLRTVEARLLSASRLQCLVPPSPFRDNSYMIFQGFHATLINNRRVVDPYPRLGGCVFVHVQHGQRVSRDGIRLVYFAGSIERGDASVLLRWRRMADVAQVKIAAQQRPTDCATARMRVAVVPTTGAGAQFAALSTAFAEAFAKGEVMVLDGAWNYAPHCADGFACFLEPLSNCSLSRVQHAAPRRWSDFHSDVYADHDELVPREFAELGWTWWRAQLLRYLLRPLPPVLQHIAAVQRGLAWQRPIIGVHIRRGERLKRSHERHDSLDLMPAATLDQAMQLVLESSRRHGIHRVFVATDSAELITSLTDWAPQLELSIAPRTMQLDGRDCLRETSVGCESGHNQTQTAVDMLTDLWLLSQSDVLVGTFGSTFSRIPQLLMMAHGRNLSQFASLE